MFETLKTLDLRAEQAAQAAYDYAWDRWGLGIGTVRWGFCLLYLGIILAMPNTVDPAAMGSVAMSKMGTGLLGLWAVVALFLVLCVAAVVSLWLRENKLQAEGSFAYLNIKADRYDLGYRLQNMGVYMIVAGLFILFWGSYTAAIMILLFEAYMGYALALKVRQRDEERFKQYQFQPGVPAPGM